MTAFISRASFLFMVLVIVGCSSKDEMKLAVENGSSEVLEYVSIRSAANHWTVGYGEFQAGEVKSESMEGVESGVLEIHLLRQGAEQEEVYEVLGGGNELKIVYDGESCKLQ